MFIVRIARAHDEWCFLSSKHDASALGRANQALRVEGTDLEFPFV